MVQLGVIEMLYRKMCQQGHNYIVGEPQPLTLTVRTHTGNHYMFRYPDSCRDIVCVFMLERKN